MPQRAAASRPWLAYAVVCLAVLAAFCVVHYLRPIPAFPWDDPYIDLHSAQVLHAGSDPNYPGVPALFGVTSAPFVGLIYLLLFVLSPLHALDTSCWIGVLFYGLGLARLARVLRLRSSEQWLLVFLGLACAPVPVHWLNGLETSCALASVTWTLCLAAGDRRGWIGAAFLAGLSACLRPDLLPFAFLLVTSLAWQMVRFSPKLKDGLIGALPMLAAAVAPLLLCGYWYFHMTGSPFPLTGVAKRYFFAEDHWPLLRRVGQAVGQGKAFVIAIGPLVLVFLRMGKSLLGKVLLVTWGLFAAALFVQFPGQFAVNEFRYPVVLIPTLLWTLGSMLQNTDPRRLQEAKRLMYFCTGYAILMLPVCLHFYREDRIFFEYGSVEGTKWCQQHLAPGTSILVHDAGYLAYSTDFRTIDFVGLKTPAAIAINRQYTWASGGRDRAEAVSKIASESGSRYLILNSHWGPVVSLPDELRSLGWKLELLDSPGAFRIYRITPPAA
ncbi:MAG TPA: hypothetical protein VF865_09950 [Acidobacteriaceae bacterium]